MTLTDKLLSKLRSIHVFDNAKQTRQFWSLTCSAVIIGMAWGEYLSVIGETEKIFLGVVIGSAIIVMAVTLMEIFNERKERIDNTSILRDTIYCQCSQCDCNRVSSSDGITCEDCRNNLHKDPRPSRMKYSSGGKIIQ